MPDICKNPLLRGRKKRVYIIDQHNISPDGGFVITINTALGTGDSFTLPLPIGETYDFWWNPGDGSPDKHVTAYNDANITHTYSGPFSGQIIIGTKANDKCGGWSFNDGGDKLKLVSIDQWGAVGFDYMRDFCDGCSNLTTMPSVPIPYDVTSLASAFASCTSLSWSIPSGWLDNMTSCTSVQGLFFVCSSLTGSIPSGLFDNLTGITSFTQTFINCSGLTGSIPTDLLRYNTVANTVQGLFQGCLGLTGAIPSDLFRYNTLITNFTQTFYDCRNLTGAVPTDLFRYNTLATTFNSTFYNCWGLTSLPNNLFYYNSLVTNYSSTFLRCRNLALPATLFNLSNLSGITTFINFMNALITGYSNTGTIQDIWNYATSASSSNAFLNQTALTNYASIPNGWKGL